jgi:type II secretory pathway pseudopilin PulG
MNNIINKTMKMNKTATKLKPGMTLIEITVVILVLLTLIAVLFIGANIYKKGANRAACILNIRNIHQAVRADQNLNKKNTSDALVRTVIMGDSEAYIENEPTCPADGGAYGLVGTYPLTGVVAATCTNSGAAGTSGVTDHLPDVNDTQGW